MQQTLSCIFFDGNGSLSDTLINDWKPGNIEITHVKFENHYVKENLDRRIQVKLVPSSETYKIINQHFKNYGLYNDSIETLADISVIFVGTYDQAPHADVARLWTYTTYPESKTVKKR
jgi:hypothetical protein